MKRIKLWLMGSPFSLVPVFLAIRAFFVQFAMAQTSQLPQNPIATNATGVKTALCSVAGFMFDILIVISVIMALYAAYTYVTAGDDTEKTSKARRTLTYAAVGIVVALIANGFPAIVSDIFGAGLGGAGGAC